MIANRFRWLRAYPALLKANWARSLEYRSQTIIWILSGVLPLIMMLVWLAVAEQQGGQVESYDRTGFISYYLGVILLRRLVGVWIIWDLDRDIRLGSLSPQLLRPLDPAHNFMARIIAQRPIQFILITPPVALGAWLWGARYDLAPGNLFLVLLAIIGAMLIEFLAQMVIACLAFWITQAVAIANVWFYLRALFSGWVIPIDLFPTVVTNALTFLSFRYQLSFPVEILLGRLSSAEIAQGFLVQYGWVLFFFVLYRLLWRRGLKHYGAVGA